MRPGVINKRKAKRRKISHSTAEDHGLRTPPATQQTQRTPLTQLIEVAEDEQEDDNRHGHEHKQRRLSLCSDDAVADNDMDSDSADDAVPPPKSFRREYKLNVGSQLLCRSLGIARKGRMTQIYSDTSRKFVFFFSFLPDLLSHRSFSLFFYLSFSLSLFLLVPFPWLVALSVSALFLSGCSERIILD